MHIHTHTGDDSDGEWIDMPHASDSESDNDVHKLELESEDESDNWMELKSESESESESLKAGYVVDCEGEPGSVPFQDQNGPILFRDKVGSNTDCEKKVQFSDGVKAPKTKEMLAEVKEQRRQRAGDIAQSRVSHYIVTMV